MSVLNINKTTTDPNDNIRPSARLHKDTPVDYKGITLLIIGIATLVTIIWIIMLLMSSFVCYINDDRLCATVYIFWGYVIIVALALIPAIIVGILVLWRKVQTMQFLYWRGVYTHIQDTRVHAASIIDVARQSAQSEATAGLDNYSPTFQQPKQGDSITKAVHMETEPSPIDDLLPISLGDL